MSEFVVRLTEDYATNPTALQAALEEALDGEEGQVEVAAHSPRVLANEYVTPVIGEMLFNALVADNGHPEDVTPESYLDAVRFAFATEVLGRRDIADEVREKAHGEAVELARDMDDGLNGNDIIADGGVDIEDIEEERLERLANSPLVELILACEDVVGTAKLIQENEYMWDRLVRDVARSASAISSEATAEEVISETINQMERYGALGKRPDDPDEEDEGGE